MSKRLSQSDLDKIYKIESKQSGTYQQKTLSLGTSNNETSKRNSIFLCHSHRDKTIVRRVVSLFSRFEIDLYIDWMDVNLPEQTNRETASLIKQRISQSDKFLFLATYNALKSRWCSWELGLAFSTKTDDDFAILPIESRSGNWSGNEYLSLYPEMKIDFSNDVTSINEKTITINHYSNKIVRFENWFQL